jgi:hypothetical protein
MQLLQQKFKETASIPIIDTTSQTRTKRSCIIAISKRISQITKGDSAWIVP